MKVLDTFSGAGGFSLGFEQAGCEVIGAIEIDQWASDTFKYNHPNATVIKSPIEDVTDDEIIKMFKENNPDIILGGPPCQGFSICTKFNGDPKDPRNSLFEQFIRVGKLIDPKIMVMENVPNLINAKTSSNRFVIDIITDELESLGFFVYKKILEAVDYGVPQIRKRIVVVASKIALEKPFPDPTHYVRKGELGFINGNLKPTPSLWEAISDLPEIEAREGSEIMDYTLPPQNEYQRILRHNQPTKLHNHLAMKHSKRLVDRFAAMSWGDTIKDVPDELKPIKRNSINVINESGYDQSNRRMHPDKPCHTIPASFYANFVHPYKNRNFTAREGARLQSFPDSYVFLGKPTVVSHKLLHREGRFDEKYLCQYNQIGNAVPPLMAKAIAQNIMKQYGRSEV